MEDPKNQVPAEEIQNSTSTEVPAQDSTREIEVDGDNDSALGEDDYVSSTHSLESTTQQWQYENGRRYHGFRSGKYNFPNDEAEAEREDIKHHVTRCMLDLGTGTGMWAIDFADENPASHVIAVDLSPIQPDLVPPNLEFQIDDIEDTWTYNPSSFDYIHCRYMSSAVRSWPKLLAQAKETLTPGGKIELVDFDIEYTSDDGTVKEDNKLYQFMSDLRRAGPRIGINLSACKWFGSMLAEAGYTNVQTEVYKLPFGPWPKDKRLKEIGYLHREQFSRGVQGIAFGLYGRGMQWKPEEIEVMLTEVRRDMANRKFHGYWLVYFTTAEVPSK